MACRLLLISHHRLRDLLLSAGPLALIAVGVLVAAYIYLDPQPPRTVRLAIHRGLLNYGIDGKHSPELAESYQVSGDGVTYTFTLRQATFHDGSPVTAADVKATFDGMLAATSRATYKGELSIIQGVEAVDAHTVRFTLGHVFAPFVHYLALPESAILPKAWLEKNAGNANAPPIGAGPFRFVNWSRGREILVQKFPGYYKPGKPALDEVHYVWRGVDGRLLRSGSLQEATS